MALSDTPNIIALSGVAGVKFTGEIDLEAFVNYIKANGEVNPQIEGRVIKLN